MRPHHLHGWQCALLLAGAACAAAPPAPDPLAKLPAVFSKRAPESLEDLRAIERHVDKVLQRVTPAIVCVRIGNGSGTGVIVSPDGLVLTAGHVCGAPGRPCTLIFPDGKTAKGKTLGLARGTDSGMIQITSPGKSWPSAALGRSSSLKPGDWCIARGHPGGFKKGRAPVVRVGRVLGTRGRFLAHDCALVGGDSGGPLFDMRGRVIGIESNIGRSITQNNAVPIDAFRPQWGQLVKGEVIGGGGPLPGVYLGVNGDPRGRDCRIVQVAPGSPAGKGGIKVGDVVVKFAGKPVTRFAELAQLVRTRKAGDVVEVEVRRGDETMKLKITLAKR